MLLAAPALHFALTFAQISAIGLLCVTGGFFALRANRPFLAGLAVGSLIYKPQLGLAAAFIFVGAREWRIVLGATVGAALQLAAAAAFWGPSILRAYGESLVRLVPAIPAEFEPFRFQMHSWMTFFELLGLPREAALVAYALAAFVTLLIAIECWRARGPLALRYSVFLIATVLVNPHMYVYDLVLLTPAFFLLWDRGRFPALLYFCYFSPLFAALAQVSRVQLSVLALTLLALAVRSSLTGEAAATRLA
jgi:hypothetical protein